MTVKQPQDTTVPSTSNPLERDAEYWQSISPFELSTNDLKSLLTPTDAQWQPHTWPELKSAVQQKDLSLLTRNPTSLRAYIHWLLSMRKTHPDISQFVLAERLHWPIPDPVTGHNTVNPTPFASEHDYKVLRNDWPYGIEEDVHHVVIWLKTAIPVDEVGDVTSEAEGLIEEFVQRRFRDEVGGEGEVLWYRNQRRWQSVKALEHVHVLVKGVSEDVVERWTGQRREDIVEVAWKREHGEGGGA